MKKSFRIRIYGRVQGVGYRAATKQKALSLGLTGNVRNRLDGSVEALISGTEADCTEFVAWAHTGPSLARVNDVIVETLDSELTFTGFQISHGSD